MAQATLRLIPGYTTSGAGTPDYAGSGSPLGAIAVIQVFAGVNIVGSVGGGFNPAIYIGAGVL